MRTTEDQANVSTLILSPSEDLMVCVTANGQLLSLLLSNTDVKGEEIKFDVFAQPFHYGQITGMDTVPLFPNKSSVFENHWLSHAVLIEVCVCGIIWIIPRN